MLDINLIREHPETVKKDLKRRNDLEKFAWVDELLEKDKKWRKNKTDIDDLRHKRNTVSEDINKAKKEGKEIKHLLEEAKEIPQKIKELEEEQKQLSEKILWLRMRLPNIMHESVPFGKDSSENLETKKLGKLPTFNFELKPHGELIESMGLADFNKAAEVAGQGFNYVQGDLALLDRALQQFAIEFLVKKGYILTAPPHMLRRKPYEGVVSLDDFENVMYKIENDDLYLIATSEHPMAALYMGETLTEDELPIRLCGISPCYRREIGAHGVDTKGFFRMHQFNKIEQFIFCKPEESWKFHEELQQNSEEMYTLLEIPFRVVNVCTGDLGIIAAKKYDIEAWFPRQNKYGEVGSNSNCTDYQARRLNIKFEKKDGTREFIHTLNNTGIATSRAMVAILENFQNSDGTVSVPKALQQYMLGKKKIMPFKRSAKCGENASKLQKAKVRE